MDLWITFIGTSASVPTAGRGTAATLVARGGDRLLVDCGEGTQRQLLRSGLGLVDVDAVLLTHLHGDHYLGLPGLLKTFGLRDRTAPLPVVGPPGLAALLGVLRPVIGRTAFPLEVREVAEGVAWTAPGARVEAFPTRHSVPSVGYALIEEARPGAFDVDAARSLGVPPGPLFGRLQRGQEIALGDGRRVRSAEVLGPPRPGRRVVLTGDTEPCAATVVAAHRADLLVHEATFAAADGARARATRHSTAREAAEVGRQAEVALLALTHLSNRLMPRDARAEAEAVFPRVVVPRDFDQVEVPFPERGAPVLHPGGARRGEPAAAAGAPVAEEG
ncbi:MAG TPA: ribonuclease Z, partial [Miltoncostaeaceae bacterium]|nr:ribonuclease Z [Miltoncostaeaceae bacterium]